MRFTCDSTASAAQPDELMLSIAFDPVILGKQTLINNHGLCQWDNDLSCTPAYVCLCSAVSL